MPMSSVVSSIKYKSGYKYQLVSDFSVKIDIVWYDISTDYITLNNKDVRSEGEVGDDQDISEGRRSRRLY